MSDDELEVIPDTPQMRELAEKIRRGIELHGWEKFEELFVEGFGLRLVKEEGGKRFYERADGQMKLTIGDFNQDEEEEFFES